MDPGLTRGLATATTVGALLLLASAAGASGPLEGRQLPFAGEVRSGLESVAGSLLGGDLRGQVQRAVVEEDSPRRFAVRVAYEGFAGARLWGELLTGERRRQTGIVQAEPVTLSDAAAEVVLEFTPEPGVTPSVSSVLRISVAAPNRHAASYVRSFRLDKPWSAAELAGSDFTLTIAPRPIGSTAGLGPTPTAVVPQAMARVLTPPAAPAPGAPSSPAAAPRTATTAARTTARSMLAPPAKAAAALPPTRTVSPVRASFFGLDPADANLGALGPAPLPLRPFAEVRTEDIQLDLTRVLNVFPDVYPDQRAESGIYYVLPYGYSLSWAEGEGYAFRSIVSAAAAGAAGEVLMSARLDAGITARDLAIVAKVVKAYAAAQGLVFRELRPLPVDTLAVSISDDLGRYSIQPDRVSVHGLTDVTGQLEVSWMTDERTRNFIQEALVENVGINGGVACVPTGRHLGTRIVPLRMQLADYGTFGPFRWDRTGWRNPTPYPVTLRYLHALRIIPGGPPVVYSWGLGDSRVPPGGTVRWSSAAVPGWIDTQAEKVWLDYAVDASCRPCGTGVLASLTGGVSSAGAAQITFHSLTPLAETGAHDVQVEVRSRWFDPRGAAVQTRAFIVDGDEKDFTVGPMYLDGRAADARSGPPLFEYRLALTRQDGEVVTGNGAWVPGAGLRVPIGRRQLELSIGTLPGR